LGHTDVALRILTDTLEHETPFVRLRALNVLYHMGDEARPAVPAIKKASLKGIYPAEYVSRLSEYLPERLGDQQR
jgi:hypothetical protein